MLDPTHAALLRSVAERGDDNTPRFVLADWLEEHGEASRAEFIRVQCELVSPQLSADARHALRMRERDLLNAHRDKWCQALGLPVEDIYFERGLISGIRLLKWQGSRILDSFAMQQLAPLTELDLSGLRMGDDGVAALADRARLPGLRRLILSDNGITDVGVLALVEAKGLPRLDSLYLFQNPIGPTAYYTLESSSCFCLGDLDLGERADGYCMSPGEADMARRHYLRNHLLPTVRGYFNAHERLRSAMLCVAQYWDDQASDAVHGILVVSELVEPTLEGVARFNFVPGNDPNIPNTQIQSGRTYGGGSRSTIDLDFSEIQWLENTDAIPLWAAFAPEGGNQEYEKFGDAYSPAVMFYRHGGYTVLPILRPQLDGIRPLRWNDG
ncbi:TIGR02996 domain-containing protein [Fimbriiglobus ruber]|uniref:Uncharacterized protein n=1 Tax=Fimbriiglobus ruber TaxID=1908690 RepID=A0A225DG76_9BACT|nr:TIGR02996 domain-containing protein [Fimbriiglobus ruber]OWK40482.1 hypothetical protein FRUB_05401 [Fimbriiglobus ruber]